MRQRLRPLAAALREARAHASGVVGWAAGGRSHGTVRVSYGLAVPRLDEPAIGGIVKLQHLRRAFQHDPRRFDILYLVSSRLPDSAVTRARWAHRQGARVVVNQNGVAYPGWYGQGWEKVNAPMTALLRMADHVFYQSAFCRASADRFAAPAAGSSEVLFNPVDTARFVPAPKPPSRCRITLLLAGSQDQRYRVESAVGALAMLRKGGVDAELLITGRLGWHAEAPQAQREVDQLLESHGIREWVQLLGPYTQAEAPAIYQRADIVLHTKYNDPCPTVVLEAMAAGRPIVYSKSGGVPELVGDEAGVGVEASLDWERDQPPAPEAVARGVDKLLQRWESAAAAARARAVAAFDVSGWLARHEAVFRQVLEAA